MFRNDFGSLLCTGYFLVTFFTTIFMIKEMKKTEQTEKMLEQYRTIADYESNKLSELRQFRHDYLNLCSSMEGYIEGGDLQGLKIYFKEELNLMKTEIGKNTFNYGMIKKIKIPEICGLFYEKLAIAYEKKLNVTVRLESEIVKLNMKPVHFIRIAGIWLDNAIEAAEDSADRELGIIIALEEQTLTMKIWNSYRGGIELGRIQEEGYSTKGEGRGYGLAGVRKIICKYPKIYTETTVRDGVFIQSIRI